MGYMMVYGYPTLIGDSGFVTMSILAPIICGCQKKHILIMAHMAAFTPKNGGTTGSKAPSASQSTSVRRCLNALGQSCTNLLCRIIRTRFMIPAIPLAPQVSGCASCADCFPTFFGRSGSQEGSSKNKTKNLN